MVIEGAAGGSVRPGSSFIIIPTGSFLKPRREGKWTVGVRYEPLAGSSHPTVTQPSVTAISTSSP